jgi:hypothetical protein
LDFTFDPLQLIAKVTDETTTNKIKTGFTFGSVGSHGVKGGISEQVVGSRGCRLAPVSAVREVSAQHTVGQYTL